MKAICQYICSLFYVDDAASLAAKELAQAKRELLGVQTQYEYCKHIVAYNTERVARLERYISRIASDVGKATYTSKVTHGS